MIKEKIVRKEEKKGKKRKERENTGKIERNKEEKEKETRREKKGKKTKQNKTNRPCVIKLELILFISIVCLKYITDPNVKCVQSHDRN